MQSLSRCADVKVLSLLHCCAKQYGKLRQSYRNGAAIRQAHRERVGFEMKVEDAYVHGSWRRGDESVPVTLFHRAISKFSRNQWKRTKMQLLETRGKKPSGDKAGGQ
jgi:hypothetical protein